MSKKVLAVTASTFKFTQNTTISGCGQLGRHSTNDVSKMKCFKGENILRHITLVTPKVWAGPFFISRSACFYLLGRRYAEVLWRIPECLDLHQ